jgi:rhodanese-related sulfurtransferase
MERVRRGAICFTLGLELDAGPCRGLFTGMSTSALNGSSTMSELLQTYPGAQRALFAKYHIGGCKSCGFSPNETVEQVCARNDAPVEEVISHIQASHDADQKIQLSPVEFSSLRASGVKVQVLDARTREEHEAVKIEGSQLLTQDLVQTIFNSWSKEVPIVIYDHQGTRSLDAAAYFIGHGFAETKCLAGGIDAYSVDVDSSIPRYRLEIEG